MSWKAFVLVVFLLLGLLAYFKTTDLPVDRRYTRVAANCAASPSSACLGELAVLRLPKVLRWDDFARHDLRKLGYDEVVNERLREQDRRSSLDDAWRRGDKIYAVLRDDVGAFLELHPIDTNSFYLAANRLQRNYPGMGER